MRKTIIHPFFAPGRWGLLVLVVAAGLTGCKKQPFLQTVEQTPYLGLPAAIDHLHHIDLERLRIKPEFAEVMQKIESKPEGRQILEALRQQIAFDPVQKIDLLVIASRGEAAADKPLEKTVFVARGHFEQPEIVLDRLRQWLGEDYLINPPPFQQSTHPGSDFKQFGLKAQSQYNETVTHEFYFGFPSEKLMVFSTNKALVNEVLDVIGGTTPGIQKDPNWLKMLKPTKIEAAIRGTGNMKALLATAPKLRQAFDALQSAQSYYYNVNFGQEFTAELGFVCDSIDSAGKITQVLSDKVDSYKAIAKTPAGALLPETIKMAGKLRTQNELEKAMIQLTLTHDEVKALMNEWTKLSDMAPKGELR